MSFPRQKISDSFEAVIARLDTLLTPWGFTFVSDGIKSSHCGPFACGHYCRETTRIGLSCRGTIDNVYYEHSFIKKNACSREVERFTIGHGTLMNAFGRSEDCRLICSNVYPDAIISRDGGDRLDALIHDLDSIASTVLREPCEEFYAIMRRGIRAYTID